MNSTGSGPRRTAVDVISVWSSSGMRSGHVVLSRRELVGDRTEGRDVAPGSVQGEREPGQGFRRIQSVDQPARLRAS